MLAQLLLRTYENNNIHIVHDKIHNAEYKQGEWRPDT